MVHMTLQIFDITVEAHVRVAKQCDRRPRFVGERFFKKELMARQTVRAENALETPTMPP